ncbi:MAG: S9 family peptidase [Deltaproteobacteria bacterium]|nr:S9 family peptidase [Deltaproteobacteria bacterium]
MRRLFVPMFAALVIAAPVAYAKLELVEDPEPPVAKKVPHTYAVAGKTLTDDYAWLKDPNDPDRLKYLQAETDYAAAMLAPSKPLADTMYAEMLARVQETDAEVPVVRGAYEYTTRTEAGQPFRVITRHALAGGSASAEQPVLDLNQLATENHWTVVRLGDFEVSDDGRRLAYTIDATGGLDFALYVKDLATGKLLDGPLPLVTSVAWAADNQHVLFTTSRNPAKRSDRVWCHKVGRTGADRLVYAEADEHFDLGVQRSKDDHWLVLGAGSSTTSEQWLIPATSPEAAPRTTDGRHHDHLYAVVPRGDQLFIRSNLPGRTYGVFTAPIDHPDRDHWTKLVDARKDVTIESIDVTAHALAVVERDRGKLMLRVFDDALAPRAVTFPDAVYTLRPVDNLELDATAFRIAYESPITPPRTIDVDVASLKQTVRRTQPVPTFDGSKYTTERISVKAADGTQIPVSLVYRKGYRKDGKAPMLLTGYGAYGFPFEPEFDAKIVSLLDRGVIYAIAHVRGGGDLGVPWYDDGKMMHKKNTFTDFIAVADDLVKRKYTARAKLAIRGGSAGGLLIGAVITMRPDLCRVAIPYVPFVDVINTMLDESLPLTVGEFEEWGNPKVAAEGAYMLSYSPYENLKRAAYPSIYIRSGLNDAQVLVHEPAKFVARLRTLKTDHHPLILNINMGAGHGGAANRYLKLRETATEWAWMLAELGVP